MRFALALGLLFSTPASATTGLAWQWQDGQVRQFYIQTQLKLSEPLLFKADQNHDVRVSELQMNVNTACVPTRVVGKHAWELQCTVNDISLRGSAYGVKGRLKAILDEFDQKITADGAYLQLIVTDDGRVRSIDLEGVDKRNQRIEDMHVSMRLALARVFAALDLQLPKKGDDKGRGAWPQRETQLTGFPSQYGSLGLVAMNHSITGSEGEVHEITTSAHGTVGSGEMTVVNGVEKPANLYEVSVTGSAKFDAKAGALIERAYLVEAIPTASSKLASFGAGVQYIQAVSLTLVDDAATIPALGDNEEFDLSAESAE